MIIDHPPNFRILAGLQRASIWLVIIVLAVALLVLAGWVWDIPLFTRPLRLSVPMNPITALACILLGSSRLLMASSDACMARFSIARGLASLTMLMVLLRMLTLLRGFPIAIDLFLFESKIVTHDADTLHARMSLSAAFSLFFLSSGLLLMPARASHNHVPFQVSAIAGGLPAFFYIIGYLYKVKEFYGVFRHLPMAIHTAGCCLLLSLALLFARPGEGLMKDLTSDLSGGVHARLFIPVAVFVPMILGLLRLYGYWAGFFSTEFGVAILVFSIVLIFVWTIRLSTMLLNKRDAQNNRISEDLIASENLLRLLVNSVQDYAIFMLDASGHITSWNIGAEKIKGYKAEEVIGKPICIFYSPEDIEKKEPGHNLEMAKVYGHYNSEGWRIRKDGTRFWADIVITAVYDQNGHLQGFTKITRNRTEFKKAQEQIAYQARLMEDTSDAIISVGASYLVVSWNKGAERLYGYSATETIGRNIGEVAKTTSESSRAENIELLRRKGRWKGEVVHLHRNGAPLYLLFSISETKDAQGTVEGYVMVARDISERKAEEDRLRKFNEILELQVKAKTAELRTVFERVSDGFMAFDKSGHITYVNQKAAELNKLYPQDLIGKNFWNLFPTAVQNEFGENFDRALDSQQNIHFQMFSPSLQLWIECFMYPSRDGLSLFFRDISERRKSEEAISRTSEELRQLASHLQDIREEERATIAREIHDELGQQLTGIKMDISWVVKRWNKHADDPLAQRMVATLGLLDNTIKTVRRIATELRPSILDDLGLIAAIEWQSQEFTRRAGVKTHFQSSVSEFHFEPSTAIGLFRICQESLTNVARHAAAKNVWISLGLTKEQLFLHIRDDGKGIGKKGGKEKKTLGLLGMKERALMMGGSLVIESPEGSGLTLEVIVPLKEAKS
jgi:PAS domain S-box-containing protein